jgi:hypothetical protein
MRVNRVPDCYGSVDHVLDQTELRGAWHRGQEQGYDENLFMAHDDPPLGTIYIARSVAYDFERPPTAKRRPPARATKKRRPTALEYGKEVLATHSPLQADTRLNIATAIPAARRRLP